MPESRFHIISLLYCKGSLEEKICNNTNQEIIGGKYGKVIFQVWSNGKLQDSKCADGALQLL